MRLATHYRVTGIHEDALVDQWLCGANDASESECRSASGRCKVIEFFHGMEDYAAYAVAPGARAILTFSGTHEPTTGVFQEEPGGADVLELYAQDEYLDLRLNGTSFEGADFQGNSAVLLFPVSLQRELFLECYGDDYLEEYEDQELGVLWDYAPGEEVIREDDPRFQKLLSLGEDYESASTEAARALKREVLPLAS